MKHPAPHKQPRQPKAPKPSKAPHVSPAQHRQQAARQRRQRIRSLQHQLHQARTAPLVTHQKPAKAKGKKPAKPRGLALAAGAECCAAEAVAASLRLTGRPVSDADVLALHRAAGGTRDAPVTIGDALEAACGAGLGGVRPVAFAPVDLDDPAAVILGVDLPGAHAVTAAGGWWLSWGGWWPPAAFGDAVVEEAWAVTW